MTHTPTPYNKAVCGRPTHLALSVSRKLNTFPSRVLVPSPGSQTRSRQAFSSLQVPTPFSTFLNILCSATSQTFWRPTHRPLEHGSHGANRGHWRGQRADPSQPQVFKWRESARESPPDRKPDFLTVTQLPYLPGRNGHHWPSPAARPEAAGSSNPQADKAPTGRNSPGFERKPEVGARVQKTLRRGARESLRG